MQQPGREEGAELAVTLSLSVSMPRNIHLIARQYSTVVKYAQSDTDIAFPGRFEGGGEGAGLPLSVRDLPHCLRPKRNFCRVELDIWD